MGACISSCMLMRSSHCETPNQNIINFLQNKTLIQEIQPSVQNKTNGIESISQAIFCSSKVSLEEHSLYKKQLSNEVPFVQLQKVCQTRSSESIAVKYRNIEKRCTESILLPNTDTRKSLEITYYGSIQQWSYPELWEHIVNFGYGMKKICEGLVNSRSSTEPIKIAIYEDTRWEWMVSCYGLWSQGFIVVTVYTNLGDDALISALQEAEVDVVICNFSRASLFVEHCKALSVRTLICLDPPEKDWSAKGSSFIQLFSDTHETLSEDDEWQSFGWEEVLHMGKQTLSEQHLIELSPTTSISSKSSFYSWAPEEVGLLMYTSGTTQDPKGVVLSHGNISAAIFSLCNVVSDTIGKDLLEDETYLAYLPSAHIFEFVAESVMLLRGVTISYGSPRTFTDITARPCGDFAAFRPHILLGVPRVFETIKKAIESQLPKKGTVKRRIFDMAYENRLAQLDKGYDTPYWSQKVFSSIENLFGNRLRFIAIGGAPLSSEVHQFLRATLGNCHILVGYGLTETSAIAANTIMGDIHLGHVGQLSLGIELCLRQSEDYIMPSVQKTNSSHKDQGITCGEICLRGPSISKGYYKRPELNETAFSKDGWFYTGDIGQLNPNGSLSIVGRVKALAKNSLGEYIAMETLESIYSSNNLSTPNGVCVMVNPYKSYIVALVLTDEAKATRFAKEKGVGLGKPWPEMLEDPEFHVAAAASLAETAKQAGRHPFECVKYVRVLNDEWTPENNMLTAILKFKRRNIESHYQNIIMSLYSS